VGLGIDLAGAGSVTNAASAAIIGVYGVFISNGAGTVVNFGSTAATAASASLPWRADWGR
jgi:hypothetical protein